MENKNSKKSKPKQLENKKLLVNNLESLQKEKTEQFEKIQKEIHQLQQAIQEKQVELLKLQGEFRLFEELLKGKKDNPLIFAWQLRKKANKYSDEVDRLLNSQANKSLVGLFGMIFNNFTLKLKLLDYYYNIWSNPIQADVLSINGTKKENWERVILIQKMTFISIMSSIEFCFKEYIKEFPNKIGNCENLRRKIYLSKIIKNSKDESIITDTTFKKWQGAIKLRNVLVHNNGIAEETEKYEYPNCTLLFKSGEMTKGDLKLFLYLLDWLLDASKEWILKISRK